MDADTAHRFWLGKVNVTVALARGQMKAKGPVAKILKLVPLDQAGLPALPGEQLARTERPRGPARRPPDAGFKDFYQYARTTRVIAGPRPARVDRLRVPEGGRAAASSWSPTR